MRKHKDTTNLSLKFALIASGRHQQDIARKARIAPQQLSHAIYGRRLLTLQERGRLARVLCRRVDELFPPPFSDLPPAPRAAEAAQ